MVTSRRTLGVFILLPLLLFSAGMSGSSPAEAYSQEELIQTGPFVDSIWIRNWIDGEEAVQALVSGEIDVMDSEVPPEYLSELLEVEYVDVGRILRNGYGCLSINTRKNPLNYTAFRRALAFAFDKRAISEQVFAGMSEPLDSCVPKVNPFSIEGRLPYSYYDANVALGNEILDSAGFLDANNDTFRESPHGDSFDVLIECASSSDTAVQIGEECAQSLQALHVNATSEPVDFYEYLNRLYFHGDYDIVFIGKSWSDFDVDWLAYDFCGEYVNQPYCNFPSWANQSYDQWRNQLLHSTDYDEVYEAAIEMQKVWVYECPMIVCYENTLLTAHRTDRFTGFVDDCVDGVGGCWSAQKVRLRTSLGGPFGGTIKWGVSTHNKYNPMSSCSCYPHVLNNLPWDTLIRQGPDGRDVPWLAESYTIETHEDNESVLPDRTRFTFNLVRNASWSDGTPLTAEDVACTINYYREAPGNPFRLDFGDLTAAYGQNPYKVIVEFSSESYWLLHTVGYKPILPKQLLDELGPDGWQTWMPNPFEEPMATSGAFNWSATINDNITEMKANPRYFYRPNRSVPNNISTTTSDSQPDLLGIQPLTVVVTSGSLIVIVGVLVLSKRFGQQ
ncbi:MAG: hypothetical protein C4K49_03775 [Candidatus Thorarchaeota archaeon]|nr:MAG: hypothetical protein C4K49_03775 [Candidatus Thorarchaeota archaeon]